MTVSSFTNPTTNIITQPVYDGNNRIYYLGDGGVYYIHTENLSAALFSASIPNNVSHKLLYANSTYLYYTTSDGLFRMTVSNKQSTLLIASLVNAAYSSSDNKIYGTVNNMVYTIDIANGDAITSITTKVSAPTSNRAMVVDGEFISYTSSNYTLINITTGQAVVSDDVTNLTSMAINNGVVYTTGNTALISMIPYVFEQVSVVFPTSEISLYTGSLLSHSSYNYNTSTADVYVTGDWVSAKYITDTLYIINPVANTDYIRGTIQELIVEGDASLIYFYGSTVTISPLSNTISSILLYEISNNITIPYVPSSIVKGSTVVDTITITGNDNTTVCNLPQRLDLLILNNTSGTSVKCNITGATIGTLPDTFVVKNITPPSSSPTAFNTAQTLTFNAAFETEQVLPIYSSSLNYHLDVHGNSTANVKLRKMGLVSTDTTYTPLHIGNFNLQYNHTIGLE